jgi:succinate dehydrogenase / fumarate reductase membrane anchor subunit
MNSAETPLHKVRGMGSAHSGTGHFWHERVTSVALIPLSLWFGYVMLGLAGTSEVTALQFLAHPWNAILMGAFVAFSLWHAYLGLQVVVDDYIRHQDFPDAGDPLLRHRRHGGLPVCDRAHRRLIGPSSKGNVHARLHYR